MNLPQHLRDVGVQEADLPHLAEVALQSNAVRNNPQTDYQCWADRVCIAGGVVISKNCRDFYLKL